MDGTPMHPWWVRHRVFLFAMLMAGMLTFWNTLASTYAEGWGLDSALQFAAIELLTLFVGFLLFGALFVRVTASRRRPTPTFTRPVTGTRLPPFFAWSERRPARAALQVILFSVFVGLIVYVLLTTPFALDAAVTVVLLGILTALFGASVVASLEERSFLVDVTGIHARRPLHRSVDVAWAELEAVGVVPATLSEIAIPRAPAGFTRLIALRDKQGRMRGTFSPFLELSSTRGAAFEAALRSHAAAHSVPWTTLTYREYRQWLRARPTAAP